MRAVQVQIEMRLDGSACNVIDSRCLRWASKERENFWKIACAIDFMLRSCRLDPRQRAKINFFEAPRNSAQRVNTTAPRSPNLNRGNVETRRHRNTENTKGKKIYRKKYYTVAVVV